MEQKKKNDSIEKYPISEIAYPLDWPTPLRPPTGENFGIDAECDNQWNIIPVSAEAKTRGDVIREIREKARRISRAQKIILDCGAKNCDHDIGACVYRGQLTVTRIAPVTYEDLEAPADPPTFITEWVATGFVRVGCFCDRLV